MQSWIVNIITPTSVSHDRLEIFIICWFAAQGTCIIIDHKNSSDADCDTFLQDSLMDRKLNRTAFIWNENVL